MAEIDIIAHGGASQLRYMEQIAAMAKAANQPGNTGDPVDNFFKRLPAPDKETIVWDHPEAVAYVQAACKSLRAEVASRGSTDPDANYLVEAAKKSEFTLAPQFHLYSRLSSLALSKSVANDDNSLKTRHLRFWRWVVQGRKDETAPLGSGSIATPVTQPSNTFLPGATTDGHCAGCRKTGATKPCTGCLVRTEDQKTFATSYCSKECQKKHWKIHSSGCHEVHQLHQGMSLFQGIFEAFLTEAYLAPELPATITMKEEGMVYVKTKPGAPDQIFGQITMVRFPHELAPSPDVACAVLLLGKCNMVSDQARPLFEMLIRPSCARVQVLLFTPKNLAMSVVSQDMFQALEGHAAMVASLPSGMSVVLDPTGMQFGWKETIAPWLPYLNHRVQHVAAIQDLQPSTPGIQLADVGVFDITGFSATLVRQTRVMDTVVSSLASQIEERYGGVQSFLRLKNDAFTAARNAVVVAAKKGFGMLVKECNDGAEAKVLRPSGANGNSPNGTQGSEKEIIWFRKREAKMADKKLRRIWKARWDPVIRIDWPAVQAK